MTMCQMSIAQNVPIVNFSLNSFGQVQLEIEAEADKYYLLTAKHQPDQAFESVTSITMGMDGNMIISEPLAAYPEQNYKITAYDINNPEDFDNDGINDIEEFNDMPTLAPLNFSAAVPIIDGATSLLDHSTYSELAVVSANIPWAPFLNDQEFAKFCILNQNSDNPEIYFINSKTHDIHASFYATIDTNGDDITSGEIVYNPNEIMPNGVVGSYTFNYSFGDAFSFDHTRRTFELLARNMPFLQNNFKHFIGEASEDNHNNNFKDDFIGSRITVSLESDVFADIDYIPFNQTEGYGFFRHMDLDETPGSRDIVLYDALPNTLPRVGGIITSVIQTPLSHVNLRAIQDNVPNAYIKEPLLNSTISNLLGKYIYYKVGQDDYEIREASLEEVNAWFEALRPTEEQIPERDLSETKILPLDSIRFDMSTSFGAKCSNVATMGTFGFPEGTIPEGFGIPFYFYDEFMKYNGFYEDVENMIADPDFVNNLQNRIDVLKEFRKEIKAANMPQWMLDELQEMHDAFPEGTAVRCRSSTNNEDLPGFSGAGLYTSKTQHLDEGHISKSVKQVYASMWNFRAFEERDFYRVDHYIAAMGILCHPNYQDEKSNGVGVSIDPVYSTENTYYLNTQVGESLITNPDANTIPEEILLYIDPNEGYSILRGSNLVPLGELVMGEEYLNQMREYLGVIHEEFAILYNVVGAEGFGMDIEYKVTKDDQLIIKQARPWVSFWSDIKANFDLGVTEITEPVNAADLGDAEIVTANISNQGLRNMKDFELGLLVDDQLIETLAISDELTPQSSAEYSFTMPQDFSLAGDYNVAVTVTHPQDGYATNDTLRVVISKLHLLEAGLSIKEGTALCGSEVAITANIINNGATTFTNTEIEVVSNGMVVDTFVYDFNIPYSIDVDMLISITENLQLTDNVIELNLVSVNGEADAISDNNNDSYNLDLESEYQKITLTINADNYPEETSWELYDAFSNELIGEGHLSPNSPGTTEEYCVDYSSCFELKFFDSYGDGICCDFGVGNFSIQNSAGEELVFNDGDFGNETEELFCPNGEGCAFTAIVTTNSSTGMNEADGSITINPTAGLDPYEFSIDGGENFSTLNTFENLTSGEYTILVQDASGTCSYEETVFLDFATSVIDVNSNTIKAFPNPTNDFISIELDQELINQGSIKIQIYDGLGRSVQTAILDGTRQTISLKRLSQGTYMAKIYNAEFEHYFKVVKL